MKTQVNPYKRIIDLHFGENSEMIARVPGYSFEVLKRVMEIRDSILEQYGNDNFTRPLAKELRSFLNSLEDVECKEELQEKENGFNLKFEITFSRPIVVQPIELINCTFTIGEDNESKN